MFSDTYRAMSERLTPPPALKAELLSKTRRSPHALPRRAVLIAAALALCLVTPAMAVWTEPGFQLLYAVSPAAAQFFQPVQRSCTDNGVTLEVVSVSVADDTAQAYVTLTGEAVDGTCDLYDSWDFHLPFDQIGTCTQVAYDEATHTATFLCTTRTMDGSPIPKGGKMTFSLREFLSGREAVEHLAVDLHPADFAGQMETISPRDSAYTQTGGSYGDGAAETLFQALLLPQSKPLAVPVEGIPITAAGYAEGLFHVQVELKNKLETDSHCWLWLEDTDGNKVACLYSAAFLHDSGQRRDYNEFVFDISPEDLAACTLYGSFWTSTRHTTGNWRITFPLTNES